MRKYYHINLNEKSINHEELEGEALVKAGRHLIAKTLLEKGAATVDPLGPDNPLIFSAGPFAGSSFSNANRTSVGCKSPLTGGIKEANGGGTFSYGLGQHEVAGVNLYGQSDEWVVIHFGKGGVVSFDPADDYLKMGTFESAELLRAKYGKKIAIAMIGPVGEYQGLMAGISITDSDGRPSRLCARGGVGAVMGSKKVKAIVVDLLKMPGFYDRKAVVKDVRDYSKMLLADPVITGFFQKIGTMGMADYTNTIGALPTNNFSLGQQVDPANEVFKMGGEYITDLNNSRGGNHTHACMPGCVIQCSNVYVGKDGKEIASPIEYETLGLLGTNCGITDPDDLAALNYLANNLGVDTIETGAMLAVAMEAGQAEFGDVEFMTQAMAEMMVGSELGKLYASGTYRVGKHFGVERIPVIKKQAISAYDPRVIEVTGISMQTTAQGADHTAGNVARFQSRDKDAALLMEVSLESQKVMAQTDSLGLCIFGRSVTHQNLDFLKDALRDATGAELDDKFFDDLGIEVLKMEKEFNDLAGFGAEDDDLPEFFYNEALAPTDQKARFRGAEIHGIYDAM
ncbi:MAG: aldehyde:ferredoxin oxidoreductase [Cellvibrionaceae bacterium]|jgi:aldehyde:ferredoxin oxidoreductase